MRLTRQILFCVQGNNYTQQRDISKQVSTNHLYSNKELLLLSELKQNIQLFFFFLLMRQKLQVMKMSKQFWDGYCRWRFSLGRWTRFQLSLPIWRSSLSISAHYHENQMKQLLLLLCIQIDTLTLPINLSFCTKLNYVLPIWGNGVRNL